VRTVRGGHLEAIRTSAGQDADPELPNHGIDGWTSPLRANHEGRLSADRTLASASRSG
jgi:hypothetical protein